MLQEELGRSSTCLTVPGLGGSGPAHWQSIWERERHDCERIELGCWDEPIRNVWVGRIDQAVRASEAPPILVAHSLGCLAVVWWAHLIGKAAAGAVKGALLVAPPDVDRAGVDRRLAGFAPTPKHILPFPCIVAASRDDPYASFERKLGARQRLARRLCGSGRGRTRQRRVGRGRVARRWHAARPPDRGAARPGALRDRTGRPIDPGATWSWFGERSWPTASTKLVGDEQCRDQRPASLAQGLVPDSDTPRAGHFSAEAPPPRTVSHDKRKRNRRHGFACLQPRRR